MALPGETGEGSAEPPAVGAPALGIAFSPALFKPSLTAGVNPI